jgi:hypothetical protein
MKKILFALSIGSISLAAISSSTYAQNAVQPVAFNDIKHFNSTVRNMAALESPATMGTYTPDVKKVNAKAIKDFSTRFNGTNNAQWFSDRNGFTTYFIKDGYGNRVFYDKKGRWEYSLIFYGEDKLPKDVRTAVKSTYFDMAITLVEEVQTSDGKVFIVHLEDKANIKILKVNDQGEYEILQDLSKE